METKLGPSCTPESSTLIKKPIAIYVEQVYPFAPFAGLGIGS